MKVGKTLGIDGLKLLPKLKSTLNKIMEGEKIPLSWKHSLIILIPKANKDLTDSGAYRPISLLNQDAKILMVILTKSINVFSAKRIKEYQHDFIIGRQKTNLTGDH